MTSSEEIAERQKYLKQLRWELNFLNVDVRIRKPRNGRWQLKLRHGSWSETVLCAGTEDVYAFVTAHGRIVGPAQDSRHAARVLLWMIERKQR